MKGLIWTGTGALAGWTVAKMNNRRVARHNGRLVAAASAPPAVQRQLEGQATKAKAKAKARASATPAAPISLLPRTSRAAVLFLWLAPAKRPTAKAAGGLRYLGGWPNDNAAAAVAAARAVAIKKGLAGVLYAVGPGTRVVRTTTIGG